MTTQQIQFTNGRCLIKGGRKVIAKVYYRPDFFKGLKVSYSHDYSVEINGLIAECDSLTEAVELLNSEIQ